MDMGAPDVRPGDMFKPEPLTRGQRWVRENPMFISGLVVNMGTPPVTFAQQYRDDFKATGIHLWATGLPGEMNGWRATLPNTPWLSWVQSNGASATNGQVIGGYAPGTSQRIGYQVGDEPTDMASLQQMELGLNAVRQADPDALIFLNFNSWSSEAMLDYYGQHVDGDLISYDRYTRNNNSYETRELIREVGLRYGLPYWRYINAYESSPVNLDDWGASNMRWDAFSGLVYGYTGHTWFIYDIDSNNEVYPVLFDSADDFNAPRTLLYSIAAQINVELRHLGRVITQLTSTDVRYIPSIIFTQPDRTMNWSPGAGDDPFITAIAPAPGQLFLDISVGFFLDDQGERYVMVQNARRQGGPWPVDSSAEGTIRLTFDLSQAPAHLDRTRLESMNKLTGQVESLPLIDLGAGQAQLDITLAAGDSLLFKYVTGAPFPLGP